jgi:hypothetical protein
MLQNSKIAQNTEGSFKNIVNLKITLKMKKELFFLFFSFLFVFANCPKKDGTSIDVPCQVLDMNEKPLKDFTLSLVKSDSFLPVNLSVETQKVSDSNGDLTFTYIQDQKIFRFVQGETKGSLRPIELYSTEVFNTTSNRSPTKLLFHYDSLFSFNIRVISSLPSMKSVFFNLVAASIPIEFPNQNLSIKRDFSLSSNRLDTTFKTMIYSNVAYSLAIKLNQQDTFKILSLNIGKAAKRDTTITLQF